MSLYRDDLDAGMPRSQARLRAQIRALEGMQQRRIELVAQKKIDMDAVIEKEQRRIDNLKAQLTIGVAQ